ncbi:MAG: hypothetical protein C0467_06360 [Planctomycetaceae bacterium]|nr:hypothetical protein [Planctomycetaceae bacterium]
MRFLMDRSPTTFLVLIILAVLGIGYFVQQKTHPESGPTSDPAVLASDFGKVEAAITAAKGKVVLVDCWATWCGPCVASFPKLVEKDEKYRSKGLTVISVSLDDPSSSSEVQDFLKKQNATFTNLQPTFDAATQKGLEKRLGYRGGIPHAALFNRQGERVWTGHPASPELEAKIETELNN